MSGLTPITPDWIYTFDRLVQHGLVHFITSGNDTVYRLRATGWHLRGVEFQLEVPWSQVAAVFLPRGLNER